MIMGTASSIAIDGPLVIGYTLCLCLTGALVVQAYIYYSKFADDRRVIKALVTVVLLLETFMTVLVFYGFWAASVQHVGWPTVSSFMTLAPVTGLVTSLTQGFYCWRISSLRQSHLIAIPIVMLSLLQFISITYLGLTQDLFPSNASSSSTSTQTTNHPYNISPWLVTWLGSTAIGDLAITVCVILSLHPSRFHFKRHRSSLVGMTRLTIETGLVTTVAALLELILGVIFREKFYHVAVFFVLSKLYANCLLATLNFRLVFRSQGDPTVISIVWDDSSTNPRLSQSNYPRSNIIQIHTQVELHTDSNVPQESEEQVYRAQEEAEDNFMKQYDLHDKSA